MINLNQREKFLNKINDNTYDLVIIGGGITGAGILLDASSRGKKCLLIEKNDFASGTSSKSTKLIHGGLRYLKNLEFKMVSDVGKERNIAFQNAPHLVRPEKMLLPITKGGSFKKWQLNFALSTYDFLARVKKIDRKKILTKKQTVNYEPLLHQKDLLGAGIYAEYRTDDARLTISILKTALKYNGKSISYIEAIEIEKKNEFHVTCYDHINKKNYTIKCVNLINATGPWADITRGKEGIEFESKIRLSKGVHIVVPIEKLPLNQSVYFDVTDKRMCFAIPRGKITYIGTTDDDYKGDLDVIQVSNEDVTYLINATNKTFNTEKLQIKDVISSWAGLRPLIEEKGKKSTEISRKDELFISKSGMITIAGGKLTGYRIMAKKVVDKLFPKQRCSTEKIPIDGNFKPKHKTYTEFKASLMNEFSNLKLNELQLDYLIQNYGINTEEILGNLNKSLNSSIIEQEIMYCFKNEGITTLQDFYFRRSGLMYFDPLSIEKDLSKAKKIFDEIKNSSSKVEEKDIIKELKKHQTFI